MPSDQRTHLRFRVDPELQERLETARKKSGRTLTGEIAERLKQSFATEDQHELLTQIRDELRRRNDDIVGALKALRSDLDQQRMQELDAPEKPGGEQQ